MSKPTQRGFVILVVLLMLAVATALVASQYTVVANEAVVSVRAEDEVQARALAEGCLALLQSYADGYIGTNPPGFNFADFDGLLDRDATANTTDDFLPPIGTRVLVPRGLTPTTGATAAAHQWSFLSRGVAPNQGGCLLRVEDNSDDGFADASVPVGATGVGEGAGNANRDVPNRDRDRAIYLTAIGLYPVLPGTTADFASEKAHARVTLRRLFGVANPPVLPPAIQACHDVVIKNNANICGLGGVQGDTISFGGGSDCGCGLYTGNTVTPLTPPPACTGCASGSCSPPTVSQAPPPPCAPPAIPTANSTHYMDNKGFGNPQTTNNNIGDDSSCKVYIDRFGRAFIWDMTDPYANDPAGPIGGLPGGSPPAAPVHDCRNYTTDPVELPCSWTTTGTESVICDFSNANPRLRQTPCWKPIAFLGDSSGATNNMTSDVVIPGPPTVLLSGLPTSPPNSHFEMSSDDDEEALMFVRNKRIPNVRDPSKMFATGSASTTMCGDALGCEDCNGGSNNDWWTQCSTRPTAPPGGASCGDFEAQTHQNSRHIPWPVVFAWDVAPAFEIQFGYEAVATKPLNATILSSGKISFDNAVSFCCAECGTAGNNCTTSPNPVTPSMSAKFIPPANCKSKDPQIPAPTFTPAPPPPPPTLSLTASGYGYAFKADGICEIGFNSTIVGDVECLAVAIPSSPCVVGNIVATGSSTVVGCTGGTCSPSNNLAASDVGVCLSSPQTVGDIYSQGSICGVNNASLNGNLFSIGNVDFKNNFSTTGLVFANENVTIKNNASVDFDGNGVVLSTGNQGLSSFMETSW